VSDCSTGGYGKNDTATSIAQGPSITGKLAERLSSHGSRVFVSAKAVKASLTRDAERQPLQRAIAFNAMHHQASPTGSFREEKNTLVSNFERTYITQALIKHSGNIAMAARASNKHRRAFWALMRKHNIAADLYREGDSEH
jgi:DNA-binding NtrC family response regulator